MCKTKMLKTDTAEYNKTIETAATILKNGGIVAIPTETVYGLAASALDETAISKVFKAKGRPQDNPLIVHISCFEELSPLVKNVPQTAAALAERFWPGPLTVILPKSDVVPSVTSGGLDTVAVRMPNNRIALDIIKASGLPLAAPSANSSGLPSPTNADHVADDMNGRIDAIVDGGECAVGVESTVVSLLGDTPVILRPGVVTAEDIAEVLGSCSIDPAVLGEVEAGQEVLSPGMKYKHYSPRAEVIIIDGDSDKYINYVNERAADGVFAMCFDEDVAHIKSPSIPYGGADDAASQTRELFCVLREMDKRGAKTVYARCPQKHGVWLAVYNRLLRSAAFKVVKL